MFQLPANGTEDVVIDLALAAILGQRACIDFARDVDVKAFATELTLLHETPVARETFVALKLAPFVGCQLLGLRVVGEQFALVIGINRPMELHSRGILERG